MKKTAIKRPPLIASKLLDIFMPQSEWQYLSGDFTEMYNKKLIERGRFIAWIWYWFMTMISILPFFGYNFERSSAMLKNYFKTAYRNILKHKIYSLINLSGLVIGITASVLIALFISDELSYDKFHGDHDRIYRLSNRGGLPLSGLVKIEGLEKIPEIEKSTRIYAGKLWGRSYLISNENNQVITDKFMLTDPSFFDIFDFKFLKGNKENSFKTPNSIVLTKDMADKLFVKGVDPIGKTLIYENKNNFTVTGILEDIPRNSHFKFDFLIHLENYKTIFGNQNSYENWNNSAFINYVKLEDNSSSNSVTTKLSSILKIAAPDRKFELNLQKITDIHLSSVVKEDIEINGSMNSIYAFGSIAFLILIIACFNFINLTTAMSTTRFKEIGLRKVVGANRSQLILQFMGETLILTMSAMALSILLITILIPDFNSYFNSSIEFDLFSTYQPLMIITSIFLFTGIISGVFPSFSISSGNTIDILKSKSGECNGSRNPMRNVLVLFQFTISVILILSTLIINGQIKYIFEKDNGFKKDSVIFIPTQRNRDLMSKVEILEEKFNKIPGVQGTTVSSQTPGTRAFTRDIQNLSNPSIERFSIQSLWINENFIQTYSIKLLAGRNFPENRSSTTKSFILNETAIHKLGYANPEDAIGTSIEMNGYNGNIIGVVKDFHMVSLHTQIAPMAMSIDPGRNYYISLSLSAISMQRTLESVKTEWKSIVPDRPFEYFFVEEDYGRLYKDDLTTSRLLQLFTLIAVVIASMGLFGLSLFTVAQRKKEISIRKVLGAGEYNLLFLLSKDFLKWVIIANVIAWPAAYYAMNRWLENFVYRIDLGVEYFLVSGISAVAIALLTVSYHTLKAANSNPVEHLRSE